MHEIKALKNIKQQLADNLNNFIAGGALTFVMLPP